MGYQTKAFGGWHSTFTVGSPVHVCYLSQAVEAVLNRQNAATRVPRDYK